MGIPNKNSYTPYLVDRLDRLTQFRLNQVKMLHEEGYIPGRDFSGYRFDYANFDDLTFVHCNFSGASLSWANCRNTTFIDCIFSAYSGANFQNSMFENCVFMPDQYIYDSDFRNATFTDCLFHLEMDMGDVIMDHSTMFDCVFQGNSHFPLPSLYGSFLQNCVVPIEGNLKGAFTRIDTTGFSAAEGGYYGKDVATLSNVMFLTDNGCKSYYTNKVDEVPVPCASLEDAPYVAGEYSAVSKPFMHSLQVKENVTYNEIASSGELTPYIAPLRSRKDVSDVLACVAAENKVAVGMEGGYSADAPFVLGDDEAQYIEEIVCRFIHPSGFFIGTDIVGCIANISLDDLGFKLNQFRSGKV